MTIYTGNYHPAQKVTDEQVRVIRERRADGESFTALARCYDLCVDHVRALCRGDLRVAAGGPITAGHELREPDPWFTAAMQGLSWESAKLLVRMCDN